MKVREVSEASAHSRRAGLCTSERPSVASRIIQIGAWWLTMTASWPRAASRASTTAARIRSTIST